jgi:peptidoglycan/LPS O-acetylase OafA/YrhL
LASQSVPGGFIGIDVFLVVSGFVITGLLYRGLESTGSLGLGRFFAGRLFRLAPAFGVAILATCLLSAVVLSPLGVQQVAFKTAIAGQLMAGNLAVQNLSGDYFGVAADGNPLLQIWSLSLEQQIYLGAPFLVWAVWILLRARRRPWAAIVMGAICFAMSFSVAYAVAAGNGLGPIPVAVAGYYGPVGRAWEFLAGGALAVGLTHSAARCRQRYTVGGSGAAMLVLGLCFLSPAFTFPGPWALCRRRSKTEQFRR